MPNGSMLRVVVIRRGKAKRTEFRLREGEIGLSLFRSVDEVSPETIIAAVQAGGKQGELSAAEIPVGLIHDLGLRLVRTLGRTPDPTVNALHVEARPSWRQRLVLRLRGTPIHEWFNECITPHLAAAAKLSE